MLIYKNKTAILVLAVLISMQGCAALVVGAGVGAASAAHDRRTLGAQVDDKTSASRISVALSEVDALKNQTSITVQVFNGTALLVGQAPTNELIQLAQTTASSVNNIKKLHNQIRLGSPISTGDAAKDVWLASKVKTLLLADKRIDGLNIEIEVENGEVFLMGLVSQQEADIAVDITRNIDGVKQVVKAFEYL
ncbi:BON domain-containing protein [Flavobacterium sp. W21_SRS_FM6]|uniref:BON domain-containing protein n=1 Tax=Flavobacterium sp. W21_SRS_FM6 TaxID=3240268 RepID=UPI003F8DD188